MGRAENHSPLLDYFDCASDCLPDYSENSIMQIGEFILAANEDARSHGQKLLGFCLFLAASMCCPSGGFRQFQLPPVYTEHVHLLCLIVSFFSLCDSAPSVFLYDSGGSADESSWLTKEESRTENR